MHLRAKERSYRGQAKYLFPEDRPTKVGQDQKEETAEGQSGRKEIGKDQTVRSRCKKTEVSSDQKEKRHST